MISKLVEFLCIIRNFWYGLNFFRQFLSPANLLLAENFIIKLSELNEYCERLDAQGTISNAVRQYMQSSWVMLCGVMIQSTRVQGYMCPNPA